MGPASERILEVVRNSLLPLVEADGGELHLVSCGERTLSLHLCGRFSGCPGNTLARRHVLEPLLLAEFPGLRLEISYGPLLPPGASKVTR